MTEWVTDDRGRGAHKRGDACGVRGCRPVVVIDPESAEDVERLADLYMHVMAVGCPTRERLQAALREFAAPTPPRPDEPQGLGAVVVDVDGVRWVRSADSDCKRPWSRWCSFEDSEFADIDVVRVLSEGVTR